MAAVMVWLAALPAPANAHQDYLVHVWRSEAGLPQNSVNCPAQTPDGYLWVGTRSGGLARFDGVRFATFNPQNTPELKDVEFETMSVDSHGTLWITAGNESIASVSNGEFRLVRERNALPRWHPLHLVAEDAQAVYFAAYFSAVFRVPHQGQVNEVQRIELAPPPPGPPPGLFSQAPDGALWYVTDLGAIARLDFSAPTNARFALFQLGVPAQALIKDSAGEIWVAAGERLGVMTPAGFTDRTPANGPPPHGVRQMVPAPDGGLWIWDEVALRRMFRGQWTVAAEGFRPESNHQPLRFHADSHGSLWVIEYGAGLWHVRVDGEAGRLASADGLPSTFITCWLEDTEGNLWIGTKENGLARIRRSWFREYGVAQGIPGEVAQSVCEDAQGTIWAGTATGGLARKDGDRFTPVPLPSVPGVTIESVTVYPDLTNGVWIGTVKGSVFRCVDSQVTRPFPQEQLRDHMADVVMQDRTGRIWFGNGSGAYYWEHGRLTTFGRARGFVEDLGVRALAEGPDGTVWFGTEPGDLWEYSRGIITRHGPPTNWPNARVSALLADPGGVWVGTLGGGLLRFGGGAFRRITATQGLPDNSITQLLVDDTGHLWCGTYAGLARVALTELTEVAAGRCERITCSVYGRFDGLPAQAYSGWYQPACWRARDGLLWFTTVKGLISVNPRAVEMNGVKPPVLIEEVRVDGARAALPDAEVRAGKRSAPILINPGEHYVEFRWTGVNFTAPDKVRFRWRLEGAETHWREEVNTR
jgi:ligand-binding sensor domain-containing protein